MTWVRTDPAATATANILACHSLNAAALEARLLVQDADRAGRDGAARTPSRRSDQLATEHSGSLGDYPERRAADGNERRRT